MLALEAIELSTKCVAVLLYYTEVLQAGPCFSKGACAKQVAGNSAFKLISTAKTFHKSVAVLLIVNQGEWVRR
jgi:hypothetical protein